MNDFVDLPLWRKITIQTILTTLNLINYVDRNMLNSIILDVQKYFKMEDKDIGAISICLYSSYMVFSFIFGIIGDRYSRKWPIIAGAFIWSSGVLLGSFCSPNGKGFFYCTRFLVGLGQAGLSAVGTPLINNIFRDKARSRAIAIYQLGLPIGTALGYIVIPMVVSSCHSWKYALRITPAFTYTLSIISIFIIPNYRTMKSTTENTDDLRRESHEARNDIVYGVNNHKSSILNRKVSREVIWKSISSILKDVFFILKNKAYMFNSIGYIFTSFATGALAVWFPALVNYSGRLHPAYKGTSESETGLIFGIILLVCAIFGSALGVELVNYMGKVITNPEPVICTVSILLTTFPAFFMNVGTNFSIVITWISTVLIMFPLCVSWTPSVMITLNIIPNQYLGLANSIQIILAHIFGDGTSPIIIGSISDKIRANDTILNHFLSLQYALYVIPFATLLSALSYMMCSFYYKKDADDSSISISSEDASLVSFI